MDRRNRIPFAALVFALALASGAQASSEERTLPSCSLTSLDGERRFALEPPQGALLWVDFWASWCDSCAASFAFLDALDREYRDQGLQVLGINLDEDPEDAQAFLASHPVGFAQAADASGSCPRQFAVPGMPAAYLIDRRGVIRLEHVGFRAGDAARIRALVKELLAADAGAPPQPVRAAGAQ